MRKAKLRIPTWKKWKNVSEFLIAPLTYHWPFVDQASITVNLGDHSNALVWPREPPIGEEEDESPENYHNQRYMRIGMRSASVPLLSNFLMDSTGDDVADLDDSDAGSITSSEESSESSEEESDDPSQRLGSLASSSARSLPLSPVISVPSSSLMAESEFSLEVTQSLERAFAEGHSVDNAAVELKTLRMASNVPLTRVREAVVAAIVDQIKSSHALLSPPPS
jgi:translation initiation factor eIF-2B subunit epsilon